MTHAEPLPRSHELMSAADTALLVVDVQTKLISLIGGHHRIIWNIRRLIDAANLLGLHVSATEQYPQGLGGTVDELAERLGQVRDKRAFSGGACGDLFAEWRSRGVYKVLLAGIEAHVCVQQTAFDLVASGFRVYVAVDATGSRYGVDYETALRRMDSAGVSLTTTEAAMFEWLETSAAEPFKQISMLVRESAPEEP